MADRKDSSPQPTKRIRGMTIEQLVGGPLSAICHGQSHMAQATSDFIDQVALDEDRQLRMVDFTFERPVQIDQADGSIATQQQQYRVQVPFISIVSVPSLQVSKANIDFTMEVRSSFLDEQTKQGNETEQSALSSPVLHRSRARTVLTGNVTRNETKNAATLKVAIETKQGDVPEGLARLLDIVNQNIAPMEVGEPKDS